MASSLNDFVDRRIGFVRTNLLAKATIGTFLIMYMSYIVPNLDLSAAKYTSNTWFRLLMFTLVAFATGGDVGVALLLSCAFIFTTDHLFRRGLNEARVSATPSPLVHAAMNPFGDSPVRPVVEWVDSRPSQLKIPNEFAGDTPDGLQPYVPDDTEQLASYGST